MKKLYIAATKNTPEINLSPEDNIFLLSGHSAPEDVRALYYPVIEWFSDYAAQIRNNPSIHTYENPLVMKIDLRYFNSSSAKFIYDIIIVLKNIHQTGVPIAVEWHYDHDDNDMFEAGRDISDIAELRFDFIRKGS